MRAIRSADYVTMEIDEHGTRRFEAFLDRNFDAWREHELHKERNKTSITREWVVGIDDIERKALYRKQYVEICDRYFDLDRNGESQIHLLKYWICDIEGDLRPVAVWKK